MKTQTVIDNCWEHADFNECKRCHYSRYIDVRGVCEGCHENAVCVTKGCRRQEHKDSLGNLCAECEYEGAMEEFSLAETLENTAAASDSIKFWIDRVPVSETFEMTGERFVELMQEMDQSGAELQAARMEGE